MSDTNISLSSGKDAAKKLLSDISTFDPGKDNGSSDVAVIAALGTAAAIASAAAALGSTGLSLGQSIQSKEKNFVSFEVTIENKSEFPVVPYSSSLEDADTLTINAFPSGVGPGESSVLLCTAETDFIHEEFDLDILVNDVILKITFDFDKDKSLMSVKVNDNKSTLNAELNCWEVKSSSEESDSFRIYTAPVNALYGGEINIQIFS